MRIIEQELRKIEDAMREVCAPMSDELYCQLYAAQQALAWVLDQDIAAAPSDTIMAGKVKPLGALGQA